MIGNKLGSIRRPIFSVTAILLILIPYLVSQVCAFSSVLAWNEHEPSSFDHFDSISDLLTAPVGSEATSLSNAKRIIEALSSSPTCAHAATARLLRQCKLIEPGREISGTELQKENAQAAYGISMALCETRQARVPIPPTCHIFETILDRPISDASIEIIWTEQIESCSNQLYHSPSWTSLMAFKAQSKDLCDSSRIDYQREELLEHFRQATNIIPDIVDALRGQNYETQLLMVNVQESAAEVVASHQEASLLMQEQAQQSKQQIEMVLTFMEARIRQINESETSFKAAVAEGIQRASTDLTVMQDQAGRVKTNLAEIYAAAAEAVSSISIDVKSTFELMMQQTNTVAEQMIDLATSGHLQAIQESVMLGRDAAAEHAIVQTAQVDAAHAQLLLSQKVLNTINHTHGRLDEIQKAVNMLPTSWFEVLHHIQENVARIRAEAKYAATFIVPSILFLLFGRARAAAVTVLCYVLFRSIWSISRSVQITISDFAIPVEELKILIFCLLATLCVASSLAYILKSLSSLLTRGKIKGKDLEASTALPSSLEDPQCKRMTTFEMFASLPRQSPKQAFREFDRFARAKSVPMELP